MRARKEGESKEPHQRTGKPGYGISLHFNGDAGDAVAPSKPSHLPPSTLSSDPDEEEDPSGDLVIIALFPTATCLPRGIIVTGPAARLRLTTLAALLVAAAFFVFRRRVRRPPPYSLSSLCLSGEEDVDVELSSEEEGRLAAGGGVVGVSAAVAE